MSVLFLKYNNTVNKTQGFTLVELAIVLTIIGLLVGGVIKGQELMANAKIYRAISTVNSLSAAATGFLDKYNAWPGDLPTATQFLRDCNGTSCLNGNGNSLIGARNSFVGGALYVLADSQADVMPCNCQENETVMFWQHLMLSDMISGVSGLSGAPGPTTLVAGTSHPVTPWEGGVIHVSHKTVQYVAPNQFWPNGGFFVLRFGIFGSANGCLGATEGTCLLSYRDALTLENKIDDGAPERGNTLVDGSNICTAGMMTAADITSNQRSCNVMIRFTQ